MLLLSLSLILCMCRVFAVYQMFEQTLTCDGVNLVSVEDDAKR